MVNKPTRFYSNKQEKKVAKAIGGKQTPNSGASKFIKGDVMTDDWLIECKTCTTPKQSFIIKREWFTKNEEEKFAMNKSYSAVVVDFGDGEQHYIISEKLFKKFLDLLKNDI